MRKIEFSGVLLFLGCTEFISTRDKARLMDFTLNFAQGSRGLPCTQIQTNKAKEEKNRAWTSEDHEKSKCRYNTHLQNNLE